MNNESQWNAEPWTPVAIRWFKKVRRLLFPGKSCRHMATEIGFDRRTIGKLYMPKADTHLEQSTCFGIFTSLRMYAGHVLAGERAAEATATIDRALVELAIATYPPSATVKEYDDDINA